MGEKIWKNTFVSILSSEKGNKLGYKTSVLDIADVEGSNFGKSNSSVRQGSASSNTTKSLSGKAKKSSSDILKKKEIKEEETVDEVELMDSSYKNSIPKWDYNVLKLKNLVIEKLDDDEAEIALNDINIIINKLRLN